MLCNQRGLTLIELLVAAIVLAIMAVAIAYMYGLGGGKLQNLGLKRQQLTLVNSKLEEIRKKPAQPSGERILDNRNTPNDPSDDLVLSWNREGVDELQNGTDYYLWTVEIRDKRFDKVLLCVKTMIAP